MTRRGLAVLLAAALVGAAACMGWLWHRTPRPADSPTHEAREPIAAEPEVAGTLADGDPLLGGRARQGPFTDEHGNVYYVVGSTRFDARVFSAGEVSLRVAGEAWRTGDPERAKALLWLLVDQATEPVVRANALVMLASYAEGGYQSAEGIKLLERALDSIREVDRADRARFTPYAHVAMELSINLKVNGNKDAARELLEEALADYPPTHGSSGYLTEARLELARHYQSIGRLDDARALRDVILESSTQIMGREGRLVPVLAEITTMDRQYSEATKQALVKAWPTISRHDLDNSWMLGDATYRAMAGLGRLNDGYDVLMDIIARFDAALGADVGAWPEERRQQLASVCSSMQGAHNRGRPDVSLYAAQRLKEIYRGNADALRSVEAIEAEARRSVQGPP